MKIVNKMSLKGTTSSINTMTVGFKDSSEDQTKQAK